MEKANVLKEFQSIPSVGKSIAEDLWNMGYRSKEQLKDKNPDLLYAKLNRLVGHKTDPCMLYTFRCIVYYVSNDKHDPKLLKWWNWSDENLKKIASD